MSDIIHDLSLDDVAAALKHVGLPARIGTIEGLSVPCVVTERDGLEFTANIHAGQVLSFRAAIPAPIPGFTDVANNWNGWQRLSRVVTIKDGYLMRYDVDISHGVTTRNMRAAARKFGEGVSTFRSMYQTRRG